MSMLIADSSLEQRLIEERQASGADQHDEVWEGVYFMPPLANDEHQGILSGFVAILEFLLGWPGLAKVRPGVNLAGFQEDWKRDYRAPDVVVFLQDTRAQLFDIFWRGAADFVIEVVSPGDRTREKVPFYSKIGVRELLIVDRQPWRLELLLHNGNRLVKAAESTAPHGDVIASRVVPLQFRLIPGEDRPMIEVVHPETGRRWRV
jgi:Uma2 family endonuclease